MSFRFLVFGGAALLAAAPAQADRWSGTLAVASDKVLRGITQSDGRAALMAEIGRQTDTGWSAALGVAGPDYPGAGGQGDVTLSLGRAWQLNADWLLQAGAAHYRYFGSRRYGSQHYNELSLALGWQGRLSGQLSWSPDTQGYGAYGPGRRGSVLSLELAAHQRLVGRWVLDAGLGYTDQRGIDAPGYAYGSVGLGWGAGPLQMSLSLIDSRAAARGAATAGHAGRRWVSTLSCSF